MHISSLSTALGSQSLSKATVQDEVRTVRHEKKNLSRWVSLQVLKRRDCRRKHQNAANPTTYSESLRAKKEKRLIKDTNKDSKFTFFPQA